MAKKTIKIEGMHCSGCSGRIERLLNALPGVSASVSLDDKEAVVEAPDDMPESTLTDKITGAGYQVVSVS
ncbi:MAG: heavy-metal-associated domain-containing protein [Clostridia bacterium]|nr:heavy-metal-associated domain-containing protein [Clostridia bacterium]